MRILITGGAGYIGSQMVRQLLEKNYEVVVFDDLSGGHPEFLPKGVSLITGDICDQRLLFDVFSRNKLWRNRWITLPSIFIPIPLGL